MNVNLNTSGIGPASGADIEAAASTRPANTSRAPLPCVPGLSELKSEFARSEAAARNRASLSRKPETMRRLHRLRRELSKISPTPSSPEQARSEIIEAMVRAELSGWTVPELSGPSATRLEDGAIRVSLISHAIVFPADGGFRIVDLAQGESLYFEMVSKPRFAGR
jgi:hypothetical protein